MRCPSLNDLPPPPAGKRGWPWTDEGPRKAGEFDEHSPWPRISIVTPSLNQGKFIEAAIRSVVLQRYPNLEYTLIDGGSSDSSVEVIRKYGAWVTHWVSEADEGQANAINKGLKRANGDIVAWLNSDDFYYPGAFHSVADFFSGNPDAMAVFGDAAFVDETGQRLRIYRGVEHGFGRMMMYWRGWDIPQPSVFMRKRVLSEFGFLDESYRFALDYEYFLRISKRHPFRHMGRLLAAYRLHGQSKTGDWEQNQAKFFHECRRANSTLAARSILVRLGLDLMKMLDDAKNGVKRFLQPTPRSS